MIDTSGIDSEDTPSFNEFNETSELDESPKSLDFDYHFSDAEMKALSKFFRSHQSDVPAELESLEDLIEDKIYNSMTISEVMNFYS
ncbi:MAG: hypothetical protein K6B43_12095 [Treponema sp.]|nr:hypothetical protein [Treponema sp.]